MPPVMPPDTATYAIGDVDSFGLSLEEVCSFYQKHWKRPIALALPQFYQWQFRQSPDNQGKDRCVVIVDEDKRLCGVMGLNERRFFLDGRGLRGAELTTWIISESCRGTGQSLAMLEYLQDHYEVLIGMGVTQEALPAYLRCGFKQIRHIPRYVRLFHQAENIRSIIRVEPFGLSLMRRNTAQANVSYLVRSIPIAELAIHEPILRQHFHTFSREAAYLKWRYTDHPVYRYEAFQIESGGHAMAVVLRVDEKETLKILHVVDAFGDLQALAAVVHFLEDYARQHLVDLADVYALSDTLGHVFWTMGWYSVLNDEWIQVPHLFHPIELKSPPTTSLIAWAKQEMDQLLDQTRLHITKGDCDLDRPTLQYLQEQDISL